MRVPGKTFYFKIQVQKYTRLSFDANCYYFPLFIYKCRPYVGIYLHMPFLSSLLVELVRMVRVCAVSY